ncbi:hypothetical protein PO124_32930 [Bacillus licheniformis]|nr:hypothetical protein [Bacillus licheniformis]
MREEYASEPHSYVKLWKHHAAQEQANRLNQIAEERNEPFLQTYGGKFLPSGSFQSDANRGRSA